MVQIRKLTTLLAGIQQSPKRNRQGNSKAKTEKRTRGDYAEDLALNFFIGHGFKLVERNFNCKLGELDLIMLDRDYLVFIEVRYRVSKNYGGALESITPAKQAKLRRAAEFYLLRTKNGDCPCRFDILCVSGNLRKPDYDWIDNAF